MLLTGTEMALPLAGCRLDFHLAFYLTESCRSRVKVSVTLLTMLIGAEKWLRDMFMPMNLRLTSFHGHE